jgi:tetratricopeptide (TPR) repeat protein
MQPWKEAWPVLSGQIPPLAEPFVPRQETVPDFAAGLPAGETIALVPDAGPAGLPGPGGTGKTTLAGALARTHHDSRLVDLVVWISATARDAIVSGYAQAGRDAGVPAPGEDADRAAAAFLDWLARSGRPWLVVLDGLTEAAVAADLWPQGAGGRVLVTADHPDAAARIPGAHLVPVGPYSPREAMAYLFAKLQADPGQRNGALELATGLGFAPAALGQAVAVISETGMDCRDYLAELTGRQRQRGGAGDPAAMAMEAWSLSLGFADHLQPAGLARRALAFLSVLAPAGVPGTVVTSDAACTYLLGAAGPVPDAAAQARAAVQNLARAGLATIDPASAARTVLVHPATAALARHQLGSSGREQVARAAADALAQAWASPEAPAAVAQALRDCTATVDEAGGAALWAPACHRVLLRAGQSLDSGGMAVSATGYWQRMLDTSRRVLGPGHPQTVAISDLLGAACEAAGRPDDAAAVYQQSLADLEPLLSADDPRMLAHRLRLARAYRRQGRPADAATLTAQVAADSDRLLGPGHPDSLAAHAELVRACLDAGQLNDAVTAAEHVLAAQEQAVGPGHPDALAARDLLASTYQASRRFKDAVALYRRSLAAWERLEGPAHPETLATRARLALAYRSAGKLKDAISHYERALADREQVQGADHPDTIRTRTELALTYYAARKFPLSIGQYERALADCERVLGPGHPFTRETRENLNDAAAGARSIIGIDLRSPGKS